jgi:hypothetical protein
MGEIIYSCDHIARRDSINTWDQQLPIIYSCDHIARRDSINTWDQQLPIIFELIDIQTGGKSPETKL